MKKLFLLAFACCFQCAFLFAQKVVENNFLTVKIPSNWVGGNLNMADTSMEVMYMQDAESKCYNIACVVGMKMKLDPTAMLNHIIKDRNVNILKEVTFKPFRSTVFMSKKAITSDFESKLDGEIWRGAIYAFNEGDASTITVIAGYKVGVKSKLPEIWRSITWKSFEMSEAEKMEANINIYNAGLKGGKKIAENIELVSVQKTKKFNILEFTYKLTNIDKDKFNLGLFQKNIENGKSAFVSDLFEQAKTQDVIKYCMQNNYRFHYIYTDKNCDILYILEIEPEDYNK